jgi:hypothetical protein
VTRNRTDVGASLEGLAAVLYRQAEHDTAGGKHEEADGCLVRALHVFQAAAGASGTGRREAEKLEPYVRELHHHWDHDGDDGGDGGGGSDEVVTGEGREGRGGEACEGNGAVAMREG